MHLWPPQGRQTYLEDHRKQVKTVHESVSPPRLREPDGVSGHVTDREASGDVAGLPVQKDHQSILRFSTYS